MKHKEGKPPIVARCAFCARENISKYANKRHQELCKDNPANAVGSSYYGR